MIPDGYNRHAQFKDGENVWNFIYRPTPRNEVLTLTQIVESLEDGTAVAFVCNWLQKHIVATDWRASLRLLHERHDEQFERLMLTVMGLVPDVSGQRWWDIESNWLRNLEQGIKLERTNKKLASRSCDDCRRWLYNAAGELVIRNSTGEPELREGSVPCETVNVGCPKGHWSDPLSLSEENKAALTHYLECKATGQFPDDPIVRKVARVCEKALKPLEKKK